MKKKLNWLLGGVVAAGLAFGLGSVAASADAIATAEAPAVLTLPIKGEEIAAYASGEKRLILVVKKYTPPVGVSTDFTVYLTDKKTGTREPVTTFGLIPGGRISEGNPASYQRFGINLSKAADFMKSAKPNCLQLEVSMNSAPSGADKPSALFEIETQ
jgi:hypothetical protein